MTLPDLTARRRAIDPQLCVCVSAPAGSGKTELLIQRFLALLARVDEPESVVAITFTRKAAAEMRARLVGALEDASLGQAVTSEHGHLTRELATAVISAGANRGWDLIATPSRLRIQTIDSFCGELTRQMPILSGSGGELRISDDADPLYREAVADFLAQGDCSPGTDMERVLLHLDNNWGSASDLLLRLLKRRDQWQRLLGSAQLDERHRDRLEASIADLVGDEIQQLRKILAPEMERIQSLLDYRASVLAANEKTADAHGFEPELDSLAAWRALCDALLTRSGGWRKRLTKAEGFPNDSDHAKATKAEMAALLERLQESDPQGQLLASVQALRLLPDAGEDRAHWAVLRSLVALLPRLAAQLLLVFRRRGQVDHAQVALAAVAALGEDESPTELALRLDHRLEHLLVDEFQDTSSGQFELLRRLTRGWADHNEANPQAARTLMLVGDAMQSIYGFREANVGLFIQARDHGIGDLKLAPLELEVNFRSTARIVDWVNAHFYSAFPPADDPQLGAVSYSASIPAIAGGETPGLQIFTGEDGRAGEVSWLCDRLEEGLARSEVGSIAVLGRSRNVLRPFLAAMRERGIAYAGRDLDPLAQRMVVRDLLTLCALLQNHFDRFAWLSLLRGPWAALDHAELLHVALALPTAAPLIRGETTVEESFDELGGDALARVTHLVAVLRWAEHYRDRLALRVWIEEVWLRLGGAAAHPERSSHLDAQQFLQLVEVLEQEGLGLDMTLLEERVQRLYAAVEDDSSVVQVMTLHKAKGLEFDWVFIPALDSQTRSSADELLLWDELVLPSGTPSFLLDIRSAADSDGTQRVYDYLKHRHREKRRLEDTRLLYVGCTRAAGKLSLSAKLAMDDKTGELKPPASGSLLAAFGSRLPDDAVLFDVPAVGEPPEMASAPYQGLASLPELESRLPGGLSAPLQVESNRLSRALGTAVHRCLESLAYRDTLPGKSDAALGAILAQELAAAGCEPGLLREYNARGTAALDTLLADSWAQWMLAPARAERAAEMPLSLFTGDDIVHLVLDYVFLDEAEKTYWIVDYKTSLPGDGQSLDDFLAAESERYALQLGLYGTALEAIKGAPVRCALYFVALGRYREIPWKNRSSCTP